MKKTIMIITLTVTIFFCACGNTNPTVTEPEKITVTPTAGAGGYVYVNSGATFEIDAPAAAPLEKVGEPLSYFEASSCAFGEQDKVRTYPGFRIDTYQIDGVDYIMDVVLTDDTVLTSEGIRVGDSTDAMITAYGDPLEQTDSYALYKKDDMKLVFLTDGGRITTIEYLSLKLD